MASLDGVSSGHQKENINLEVSHFQTVPFASRKELRDPPGEQISNEGLETCTRAFSVHNHTHKFVGCHSTAMPQRITVAVRVLRVPF